MNPTIDMLTSPLDRGPASPAAPAPLLQLAYRPRQRWVPSRYTSRTVGEDGRLILWNTLSGAISAFKERDRAAVLERLSPQGIEAPLDRMGEYLTRRGFLVREQTNELDQFRYRYAQEHWRSDKLQLILLASEDCNFRCVYCYEKFRNGTMAPSVRAGIMNMVRHRAPRLSELSVGWFGGEPLYGWEAVEELSPFFRRVADEHGLVHAQNMTTNGYLLTEERATRLLEWGCRSYQITIDGLAEEHDCKRKGRDGSPTHAVILENLRSLKARDEHFNVAIRVNFDQENVPRLGAFLEVLSEDFAGDPRFKMRFRAVGKWGGENDDTLATCGLGEKRQVLRNLRGLTDAANLRQEGGIRDAAKFGNEVCYAARPYNFIVSATGKLMKCTVVLDDLPENVVGQIHADGTMDLSDERMGKWVNPHFEHDTMCQKCHVLPTCQGSNCPLSRVTDNTRTCCTVKSELKYEMRYTLEHAGRPAPAPRAGAGHDGHGLTGPGFAITESRHVGERMHDLHGVAVAPGPGGARPHPGVGRPAARLAPGHVRDGAPAPALRRDLQHHREPGRACRGVHRGAGHVRGALPGADGVAGADEPPLREPAAGAARRPALDQPGAAGGAGRRLGGRPRAVRPTRSTRCGRTPVPGERADRCGGGRVGGAGRVSAQRLRDRLAEGAARQPTLGQGARLCRSP